MRVTPLADGEYYHVYNRGVDKRKVFLRPGHYRRFVTTIRLIIQSGSATPRPPHNQSLALISKPPPAPVTIIAYCLMPNHYHLLLRQDTSNGISEFMHKLDTSYTKYFNLNHKRTGRLFEQTFKAKHIASDIQLLHVHRYIHLNPLLGGQTQSLEHYEWSSYSEYLGYRDEPLSQRDVILEFFPKKDTGAYKNFIMDQAEYARLIKKSQESSTDENDAFL